MDYNTFDLIRSLERYLSECEKIANRWPQPGEQWEDEPNRVMAQMIGSYTAYTEMMGDAVKRFKKNALKEELGSSKEGSYL